LPDPICPWSIKGIRKEDVPNLLRDLIDRLPFIFCPSVLCCPTTTRSAVFSGLGAVGLGSGKGGGLGLLKIHMISSPRLIQ
tara:strand:- start:74 stop:316 length:243 start_codon:yes stop_codon:yes gene_type:complete